MHEPRNAASQVVCSGGVLLYPTETVYGLGGDALDLSVVERIHEIKGSNPDKPMLVLTDEWERLSNWYRSEMTVFERISSHTPTLPITFLLTATVNAPEHLVGPENLVGIRRTANQFCRQLIADAGRPLISTSANVSGAPSPTSLPDVSEDIRSKVDLVVESSEPLSGLPSTIVKVGEGLQVVREGSVSEEDLRKIAGTVES